MGAYSLGVPVPGRVARLMSDLFSYLIPLDRVRDRHTLVYKWFEDAGLDRLHEQLRRTLVGQLAFEARVTDVRFFKEPPRGTVLVAYPAVDNPGLLNLHWTLIDDSGTVEGVEGDDYVPHATPTRGGSVADACVVASQPLDPIEWTILQLDIYDSPSHETTASISLPA